MSPENQRLIFRAHSLVRLSSLLIVTACALPLIGLMLSNPSLNGWTSITISLLFALAGAGCYIRANALIGRLR